MASGEVEIVATYSSAILEDARELVSALETLPSTLTRWQQESSEANLLAERLNRRLRWLGRMHRAVYDLVSVSEAGSLDEALERTNHLDQLQVAHAPSTSVRPDPDTYAYGQELSVLHSFIETESPEVAESYTDALRRLLDLAGYDIVVEGRDEWGSWLKRMVVRARRSEAPRRLAEGLAQATHDSYLRQPAASATRDLAEAARTALDAMGEHEGCQVFDNLIVVKRRGQDGQFRSFARELSLDERRVLRERPSIIEHPASVLSELERQTMELKPGSEPMGQLGEWPEQGTPPGLPLAKGD